jgi:hypothetical protein
VRKYSKIDRKSANMTPTLLRWSVGFSLYLLVIAFLRLGLGDRNHASKVQAVSLAVAFSISLLLILGSTLSIVLKLRAELKGNEVHSDQKLTGSLALASLTAAVLMLFISWFTTAAIVLGLISLRRSYLQENSDTKKRRTYRMISIMSVAAASASVLLMVIVANSS